MIEPRIEEEITKWLTRKDMVSEQKSFMVEHLEAVERVMAEKDLPSYEFERPNGEIVKITRKEKEKKKLDKAGLAEELDVEKSELNTVGMVKLAEKDILKEKHILSHTLTEKKVEIKVKVKKPKEEKE